ncbi:MAG: hypothetical protein H0T80_15045 [Betaproteobacteria bacterium]|nr:hypothetical protein [Betaproteobacteria bacterium]
MRTDASTQKPPPCSHCPIARASSPGSSPRRTKLRSKRRRTHSCTWAKSVRIEPGRGTEDDTARRIFGVDIDPALVKLANENAAKAGVADRVQFFERDLFVTDVSTATVVTLYLLPSIMAKVETKLRADLKPGARIVSHDYPFPTWPVTRTRELDIAEKVRISGTSFTRLLLYTK